MMTHRRVIDGKTLSLAAESDFAEEAALIFDAVSNSIAEAPEEISIIQVGFWPFGLIRSSDGYMVVAPGVRLDGRPSDLTVTLQVMRAQRQVINAFSVLENGQIVRYDQKVVHHVNIDWKRSFYGERSVAESDNDSGWYFGPLKEEAPLESLVAIWARDLISACPNVVPFLQLPAGSLLVFGPQGVQTILDPADTTLFDASKRLNPGCQTFPLTFSLGN